MPGSGFHRGSPRVCLDFGETEMPGFRGERRKLRSGTAEAQSPPFKIRKTMDPCSTSSIGGTEVVGINLYADISGHFWDTSFNEHGFLLSHNGTFTQVDYPGAYQTSGNGLNDKKQMVGHYVDTSCTNYGYLAKVF